MHRRSIAACACSLLLAASVLGCASNVVAPADRNVRDELADAVWRPATAADLIGQWRVLSLSGEAASVLLDLAYFIAEDGNFSGSALFVGPPAHFEVLSGTWSLDATGKLQLGADAEPANVEVAGGFLRLSGAEGSLIFERPAIR
jgi:hypothetical protein